MGSWQRYRKRPVEVQAATWRPTEPLGEARGAAPHVPDDPDWA